MTTLFYSPAMDSEGAIDASDRALERDPHCSEAYYNRGIAHARIGSYYQAIRDCDMSLDLILLQECPP
jgi:tetratricopeptide (TPR) repeat protein